MKEIFIGNIYHKMPANETDEHGNRDIIINLCFGPIEATIYGITKDNQYYKDDTFPACLGDDELENEYRIISKSEMLEAINSEIRVCELNGGNAIAEALKLEREKIERRQKK
ncbi:hypothetical protein CCS79_08955 [Clostridium diolis]|uniref:hypothetical protein n=1 Tax=Clostridium diolis TaxID=223919 RepID=UPI000B3FD696|nr:hypothetical protein [Clostridium diolis]OVE69044.1 hypothetical protein CCS79_08955 [Clostridium diolis]